MKVGDFTQSLQVRENAGQASIFNPRLGRFAQPDTIIPGAENPQAFNRYAYVLNNPVNFVDPSGHDPWFCNSISCVATAITHMPSFMRQKLSELGKLIDYANSTQSPSDYQNAINFAVDTFNIDVSNTVNKGIYYAPNAIDYSSSDSTDLAGIANQNSLWVAVGDLAFGVGDLAEDETSPGYLLSVIQHELAHINRAVEGRACRDGFLTTLCNDLDEFEAYTIEYSYALAYQLTEGERLEIEIKIEGLRGHLEKFGILINPITGMPYFAKRIVPSPRDIPKYWLPPSPL